jgi:membrane-bound serine protease (ClpP class)
VLQVKGTIVPVVADYIDRGISEAEDNGDSVCIIELDTPGGLLSSTERIVQTIFNAHIPVVVYVSPKGAWAASAGTFITLSAHIAAMTPGTTIGAAHPVSGSGEAIPEDEMKKITEFSAKWIGAIAEDRGRNREEAEKAVTESKSFTDTDALKSNLIDLRADNLDDLLNKINGMSVMVDGQEITIDTTGYGEPVKNNMSEIEHFLLVISDPNIAYLLFTLATIGLITEVSNPGMIFPGVVGGISLLLAFYSLGVLNAYWGGLLLLFLGVGLLVAEFLTPTFGLLTAGGVTSLVIGSLILFSHSPGIAINRGLIAGVAILITAFAVFVIGAIVHSQKRRKATGPEGMLGKTAVAKTLLAPTGTVLAEGELWAAVAEEESIKLGEEVIITKVEQLKLSVTRKNID